MSEHESEFIRKMECIYLRTKKVYGNVIKVIGVVAAIIVTMGCVVIVQGFNTSRISTEALTKIDLQTINIGIEKEDRKLSDVEIHNEIQRLDAEFKKNMTWLIENGNFKYRGANPLLSK